MLTHHSAEAEAGHGHSLGLPRAERLPPPLPPSSLLTQQMARWTDGARARDFGRYLKRGAARSLSIWLCDELRCRLVVCFGLQLIVELEHTSADNTLLFDRWRAPTACCIGCSLS